MIVSRNQMEETQVDENGIDSCTSKRRKISSDDQTYYFPDLPDFKDFELPLLNDDNDDDNNVDKDCDISWIDDMILDGSFNFQDEGFKDIEGFSTTGIDNCDNVQDRLSSDQSESQGHGGNPICDVPEKGLKSPTRGNPIGDVPKKGLKSPTRGNPIGGDVSKKGLKSPTRGNPIGYVPKKGLKSPTRGNPIGDVPKKGLKSPTRGNPIGDLPKKGLKSPTRGNPICDVPKKGLKSPTRGNGNGNGNWVLVGSGLVPRAEYCPDALVDHLRGAETRKSKDVNHNSTVTKVRMHLLYLGWKIERKRYGAPKYRYISPDGKIEYSLIDVCKNLTQEMSLSRSSRIDNLNLINVPDKPRKPPISCLYKTEMGGSSSSSSLQSKTSALALREGKKEVEDLVDDVNAEIEPEYCPQAVTDWCNYGSDRKKLKLVCDSTTGGARAMTLKAKKHLVSVGWKLWYTRKQKNKLELRYTSPKGKSYISLVRACQGYMEEERLYGSTTPTEDQIKASEKSKGESSKKKHSSGITTCTMMGDENPMPVTKHSSKGYTELCGSTDPKEFECCDIQDKGISRHQEKQRDTSFRQSSELLQSQRIVKDVISDPSSCNERPRQPSDDNLSTLEKKKGKVSESISGIGGQLDDNYQSCLSGRSKRARLVRKMSSTHQIPPTILSWLIDNNVMLPRAKVYWWGRKDDDNYLFEGRVNPEGITCECCQKVISLTKFVVYDDSTRLKPADNIFLEDGRSLFECKAEMLAHYRDGLQSDPEEDIPPDMNDLICPICHYGTCTKVPCHGCPSVFHLHCLGLKEMPVETWFCPSCRCGICDDGKFDEFPDDPIVTENEIVYCVQCLGEYHARCIIQRDQVTLESITDGWFCSKQCLQIFNGLHELLGKSFTTDVNNLSWRILKYLDDGVHDMRIQSNVDNLVEYFSKLNLAVGLFHECFEPMKLLDTERDLVKEVVFNTRRSEEKRLDFCGFYTVILEKEDELISAAIVRVFGKNVAEVALICTHVQYRQQGMCRILMNEIEEMLKGFGVERLTMPAAQQEFSVWEKFGFSMVLGSDKLQFMQYNLFQTNFLSFDDTVMCVKLLSTETESRGNDRNDSNVDMDGYSVGGSEVIQADRMEQSDSSGV